ncbi:MAG TPA: sigma-70 family RNA polymerase sigma factor [Micrococcaceae bacterium]|jgi:RNA polymerase sigma-70 factor (ECF subfamily)
MRSDEADVLRALHDAHAAELWRFTTRLTGNRATAEDVVQETLFRAWKNPAVLDRPGNAVRAWLFTVARNLVVDDWRSARNRHEISTEALPESGLPDATETVLDGWLIADALRGLSVEHREVLVRGYFRRETTREIAAALSIAEGTVKSRMHYALKALKLALQERGVTQ